MSAVANGMNVPDSLVAPKSIRLRCCPQESERKWDSGDFATEWDRCDCREDVWKARSGRVQPQTHPLTSSADTTHRTPTVTPQACMEATKDWPGSPLPWGKLGTLCLHHHHPLPLSHITSHSRISAQRSMRLKWNKEENELQKRHTCVKQGKQGPGQGFVFWKAEGSCISGWIIQLRMSRPQQDTPGPGSICMSSGLWYEGIENTGLESDSTRFRCQC